MLNVVKFSLETQFIYPSLLSMIFLHTYNPILVPNSFVVTKGSKIDSINSLAMAGPLFEILIILSFASIKEVYPQNSWMFLIL